MRAVLAFGALLAMAVPVQASEPVLLHAAGSLRSVLSEVSRRFEAAGGPPVSAKFAPSGLLRDEIAGGAKAQVFASANMTHPRTLAASGKAGPVVLFARNRLCALTRPGLTVSSADLLPRMLDPAIKVGTSTPKADPSGDYAFEAFAKAEALRPGARAVLEAKALQLTGGPNSPPPPKDRNVYGMIVEKGEADIFLTYCTNAMAALAEVKGGGHGRSAGGSGGGGGLRANRDRGRARGRLPVRDVHPVARCAEHPEGGRLRRAHPRQMRRTP